MLYQRVRPKKLGEMIGNETTIVALDKIIRRSPEDRPHTFLFYGPSGCGKTTLARIVAAEFGCVENSIIELNAANTRGIDTIRDIAKDAPLSTMFGSSKAYIIDESHQLTKTAQEAFNKITEDCPKHCYFIFCTTEPHNLLATLRNRCSSFRVSTLRRTDLVKLLDQVCNKEEMEIDEEIIEAIAYVSEGSPREALVSLEDVMDMEDTDKVLEFLVRGTERGSTTLELCKFLIMAPKVRLKKWRQVLETYSQVDEDSEKIRMSLLGFLQRKMLDTDDLDIAYDIAKTIEIFSSPTYYGGKLQLGALIVKACFIGKEGVKDV